MAPSDPPASPQVQPKEVAKLNAPGFIPRHWHDPNDTPSALEAKVRISEKTSRNGSATKLV